MAFDIDNYTKTSKNVAWEDLDFEDFKTNPLPEDTLRVIRYMADVEYHTVCYMRDMLVTPSHRDRDVTGFMTMWNREEFWHGEALADVLRMHNIELEFDELKSKRLKLGWKDRIDPVKQSVLSNLVGKDFIAVHMIWGAANEWSAVAAYKRMAEIEGHPVLAELLKRIAMQEARHVAFYATQARERLGKSVLAQKFARFALGKFWGPVGSTIMDQTEVKHVMGHIFGGIDGRKAINAIDAHIAKMPGLAGLTIVADSLDGHGITAV